MTDAVFLEKLENIKCFALDLDGTLYLGNTLFPYSKFFLEKVRESQRDFLFLPNNSLLSPLDYLQRLQKLGIAVEEEQIYTSADSTLEYLLNFGPGHRLCIMGSDSLIRFFEASGFVNEPDEPDALVLGTDYDFDYSRLQHATQLLKQGVPFYATHIDPTIPVEHGRCLPDCGAIAAALTAATGVSPTVLGKPSLHMLEGLLRRTGLGRSEFAIIGDRLDSDVLMGKEHGVLSILVLAGETSKQMLRDSTIKPDFVVQSLLSLVRYLDRKQLQVV
ncbi:MAG: HAD-IIA family hydrolase [Deferribacteres bacterium]|nr:HAD-IIA family hydrolase [candidate division KSB1 bacterium]MCB9512633.1 HAD-IIA family hydrolase [Deferribacteres bacterium]